MLLPLKHGHRRLDLHKDSDATCLAQGLPTRTALLMRRYRPERMACIVVGDFDAEQVESELKAALAPVAASDKSPVPPLPRSAARSTSAAHTALSCSPLLVWLKQQAAQACAVLRRLAL